MGGATIASCVRLAGGAVCLVAAAATLPLRGTPQTPAPAAPGIEQVRASFERGAYGEAESLARQLHASVSASYPADSIELSRAADVLVEALIRNGRGGETVTVPTNGTPIAELRPVSPRRFVSRAALANARARALRVDF